VELRWYDRGFAELSVAELYAIIELRERVFVVEQTCAYLDADGADPASRHLWAEAGQAGQAGQARALRAYLRIVPAGVKFEEVSLGRIVTAPEARGTGLGRTLVARGLAAVGAVPVRIGAQAHLERFYNDFGFRRASEPYVEDGIPHVEMLRG
jgi:ElaA protein